MSVRLIVSSEQIDVSGLLDTKRAADGRAGGKKAAGKATGAKRPDSKPTIVHRDKKVPRENTKMS